MSLAMLAKKYAQQPLPTTLHHAKGWVGQLIEVALGASAQNQSIPDFPQWGIELKTIPIDALGRPKESTYVCTAPTVSETTHWATSRVRQKLARILWVPIEADPRIPLPERRIGTPILWALPPEIERILQEDWEELVTLIRLGQTEIISAKMGTYLQLRPKAAHSRILEQRLDAQGQATQSNPKGFYLRTLLTRLILARHYTL